VQEYYDRNRFERDISAIDLQVSAQLQGYAHRIADLQIDAPGTPTFANIVLLVTSREQSQAYPLGNQAEIVTQGGYFSTELRSVAVSRSALSSETSRREITAPMWGFGGTVWTTYTTITYSAELERLSSQELVARIYEKLNELDIAADQSQTSEAAADTQRVRGRLIARLQELQGAGANP
jgi:hypothetical protein